MKRKVTISSENISPKQWSVLLLELNIMQKAWGPYANLKIEAPDFERVIKWGTRRYDAREE
mgnify:CR=1 FL=1|tara:strand:- start:364 stop:546 length:183 start_codon:yes stop_codon:yes gene_type:complete